MGLTAGIVGLPNVGKSTLFNAITKSHVLAANYPFATIDPNVGIVEVKDSRLDRIVEIVKPRNVVRATVSFTDIAGLVKGASKGEGLGNQFLSHIRDVDAICQVVRCFNGTEVLSYTGKIDPIDDIETVNLELVLADLDVVEKRIAKVAKQAQLKTEKDAETEFSALTKIKAVLDEGKFAKTAALTEEEAALIKNYSFLTMKPMIYVLNISEKDLGQENVYVQTVKAYAKQNNTRTVVISAKIEEEVSGLDDETKEMFLADLGIKESGLDQLVRLTYDLLGLATYFTAGEKEAKAWTFRKGMKAPQCAGIIHTDFEKGFIRAEIIAYDDFMTYGGLLKARDAGKMRSEGKDYVFKDGDIALFRFNV